MDACCGSVLGFFCSILLKVFGDLKSVKNDSFESNLGDFPHTLGVLFDKI